MKAKFKHALLLTFFALLTFTACQNEFTEITEPDPEQVIVADSPLATLMKSTSANSGSANNVMMGDIDFTNDDVNCLSINLPVTIIVNGITIIIDTHEDLELIEDIYEEFNDDDDVLEFIFPLTIILNDYTQIVIENVEELQEFMDRCENVEEPIDCVDFKYPISFSIFNTEFQIIDTIIIEDDRALYHFLERIDNAEVALLASLNFPVKMIYANGEIVEVHNNQELERAIDAGEEMCDDDEDDCDIDDVDQYLLECRWKIHYYNEDDHFRPYDIFFQENGELTIVHENATVAITGYWNTSETDEGVVLTISDLTQFDEDLSGVWLIIECDDDKFRLVRQNATAGSDNTRIVLKRRCADEPDCSPQQIRAALQECYWHTGSNAIGNSNGLGIFHFGEDGAVYVDLPNGNEITGTWEIALTDYGIKLILDLPAPYNEISRYWKIIQCENGRIKVMNEDRYIVFERECETNPFECFENMEIFICDEGDDYDGVETFNLEEIYDCPNDDVEVSFHLTEGEAHNNVEALPNEYTNVENQQPIYVRVTKAGTTTYEIFVVVLFVEDCDETCTEEQVDAFLMETNCHWVPVAINASDDFNAYDFYFKDNQDLKIIDSDGAETFGTWSTSQGAGDGVVVSMSQFDGVLQQFIGEWLVVECGQERMMLVNNNNVELVFERECQ